MEGSSPRRRARFDASPPIGNPGVLQVVRHGVNTCLWAFSDDVVVINNFAGLHALQGIPALGAVLQGGSVLVTYAGDIDVGSQWETLTEEIEIVFAGGGSLQYD